MNRLLFIICAMLLANIGYSQSMTEGNRSMSQGEKNAITMMLGKTDAESAGDSWEKFIKDYKGKTKKNKKTGEIFSDDCRMPAFSSNTVDVYAKLNQKGPDAELIVWYDMGGAYLSSDKHPAAYAASKVMLEKFSLSVSTLALEMEMKEQEDILKKMNGEMEDLRKDQKGYEDEIAKCQAKIEEAKASMQENAGMQKTKEEAIKIQEGKVKAVKSQLSGL